MAHRGSSHSGSLGSCPSSQSLVNILSCVNTTEEGGGRGGGGGGDKEDRTRDGQGTLTFNWCFASYN